MWPHTWQNGTRTLSSRILFLTVFITKPKVSFQTEPYWQGSWCYAKAVHRADSLTWGHRRWRSLPSCSFCLWSASWLAPCYIKVPSKRALNFMLKFLQHSSWRGQRGQYGCQSEWWPWMKTLIPRVKLPYICLMGWYVMHLLSLISAVQSYEDSMPFIQRLERSSWNGWYMMIWQIL